MSPTAPVHLQDPAHTPAQNPAHPLRTAYEYLRDESDVQVPDTYEEFQSKMLEKPERMRALRDVLDEQDIYTGESYEDFHAKMTGGLKASPHGADAAPASHSPVAGANDAPRDVTTPTMAPGDEPFVTPESGQPTALSPELAQAVAQLPAAPQLDTVISSDGRVLDVARKADDGFQPVDVTDLTDQLPPTAPTYRVMNGDQSRVYYDRPLSKVAVGEDHEQTPAEALNRSFYHSVLAGAKGLGEYANAAWTEFQRYDTMGQRYQDTGVMRENTAQEQQQIADDSLPGQVTKWAEEECQKHPLSPYYQNQRFSVYNPDTYHKAIGTSAGMALPMVLSALLPESKVAQAAQKALGLMFDGQMLDGSAERAKAAGLKPGSPEYNNFVLADGTATLLVFKLGGAGLDAAAQKLVKSELMAPVMAQLKKQGDNVTEAGLGKAFTVAAQALKEGGKLGTLGAATALKDEATGRAANALLGEQKFDEHTPGQLAEEATSRGVELGLVGVASGAAGGIGKVGAATDAVQPTVSSEALPSVPEPTTAEPAQAADATGRVPVAPITDEAPKKRQDILLDLRRLAGINLRFGKSTTRGNAGSFGSYDAQSGSLKVSAAGNLDVTARAIGHALDGKYRLVEMPSSPEATAERTELMRHGSRPPADHPEPEAYQNGEAWAEYVRARLLNPDAARQQYPVFSAHYDAQVPAKVQAQLDAFGRDVRVLEGASAHDAIMSGVRMKPTPAGSAMSVLKPEATGPGFRLTFGDRLKTALLTSFHPFEKAMTYALEAGGGTPDALKPADNPALLARLYLGVHDKMDNVVEHGLVDAQNQRRIDADTGEAMTLKWLYSALDTSTEGSIAHEQEQVISSMIARRTVEMVDKRVAEDVAAALDRGQTVDPAFLAATPELERRFGKRNAENLDQKAGRHLGTLRAQGKAEQEVRDNIDRQRQRWAGLAEQAEQALASGQSLRDKLRSVEEGMGRLDASLAADGFTTSGKRVSGRVRNILRDAEQRIATLKGNARDRAAAEAAKRVQAVLAERLKGLERLEQAQLKAVRERHASAYEPRAAQHAVIDGHQHDVVTGIGAGLVSDLALARRRLADHDALATSNPAQHARIEEAARRYQAYADANLQYLVEKGRLSKEQYDAIKATNSQYVALQRVMEAEPGAEIQVFTGQSLRNFTRAATPVKALQGSGRIIKDPYGSLLEATYRTVKEADRNTILLAMRELLLGQPGRNQPGTPGSSLADIGTRAQPGDPHTVSVFVDGKREVWQLAPELYQAINELGNTPLDGPLAQLLQSPAKLLRWTVTHSPVFAARNLIRDQRSRAIISANGLRAGLRAGVRVLADRGAYRTATDGLELHGGGQAGHYLASEQSYYDTMQRTVAELAQNKQFILADPAKLAKGAWRRYTTLLGGSETLTRKQEYRAAFEKAKGLKMDDYNASLYAAHEARDLMDFAVAGTVMREVNKYVPFTNAAVQGLRKAASAAQANPGGFALRWTLSALVPTLLLRTYIHKMGRDDDYAQLPAYQRDGFDNIPLPGGKWLVVPRPFELGTMAASADRFLSKHVYGDEHAWEGYGSSLTKSFVPVDDAAVAGPLKPLVEVMTNHDIYRDKAIVPQNEERLGLKLRHTERGSKLGQWLGNAVGLDSRKVDHLVKGMGSYYGDWLLKASNLGRSDGLSQSFGVPDSGFIREGGAAHARDVEYIQRRLAEAGLGQSKYMKEIRAKADAYYKATDPDAREQAAQKLRELAVKLRATLDEQFFNEQVQEKKMKATSAGVAPVSDGLPVSGAESSAEGNYPY